MNLIMKFFCVNKFYKLNLKKIKLKFYMILKKYEKSILIDQNQ
jgi:hypothetical protein